MKSRLLGFLALVPYVLLGESSLTIVPEDSLKITSIYSDLSKRIDFLNLKDRISILIKDENIIISSLEDRINLTCIIDNPVVTIRLASKRGPSKNSDNVTVEYLKKKDETGNEVISGFFIHNDVIITNSDIERIEKKDNFRNLLFINLNNKGKEKISHLIDKAQIDMDFISICFNGQMETCPRLRSKLSNTLYFRVDDNSLSDNYFLYCLENPILDDFSYKLNATTKNRNSE